MNNEQEFAVARTCTDQASITQDQLRSQQCPARTHTPSLCCCASSYTNGRRSTKVDTRLNKCRDTCRRCALTIWQSHAQTHSDDVYRARRAACIKALLVYLPQSKYSPLQSVFFLHRTNITTSFRRLRAWSLSHSNYHDNERTLPVRRQIRYMSTGQFR